MNLIKSVFVVFFIFLTFACAGKKAPTASNQSNLTHGLVSNGHVLEGHASWYGPGFHGRRTANGEVFNKFDMTAAHKSLPFGTVLEITNPETDKTILVRINDRGPFIKGRILDLSQKAAQELGFMLKGATNVVAKVMVPNEALVSSKTTTTDQGFSRHRFVRR